MSKERDDCPHLKASAHDGGWIMICNIHGDECSSVFYTPAKKHNQALEMDWAKPCRF